ncbi:MAG: hypothetical protein AB7O97_00050 [Planctomycetota bacterium]
MQHRRIGIAVLLAASCCAAQDQQDKKDKPKFEITPAIQQAIDTCARQVVAWAAERPITAAVAAQNERGPIAGMDEKTWKGLRRRSDEIAAFTKNPAAELLAARVKATAGVVSEAFLSAARGEKVAFLEKTSSYIHAGKSKFDVPFHKLQRWQGEPEFDESSQTYAVQIAVPVLDPADPKKAIGVLVIGLNLTELARPVPAPGK